MNIAIFTILILNYKAYAPINQISKLINHLNMTYKKTVIQNLINYLKQLQFPHINTVPNKHIKIKPQK
jgi:hypothetical protein